MTASPLVSIILCTCDRPQSLWRTLIALSRVKIPANWQAELIVVENSSTDKNVSLLAGIRLPNMRCKLIREVRAGKSNALNTGLDHAEGELLVFTDDDVIPPRDWLEKMLAAFAQSDCDAIVGTIELAENLRRPWLEKRYRALLGVLDFATGPVELVGANAGIRRSVLQQVPRFDPELGPGALGLGEDTLFTWQLQQAGFKVKYAADVRVIHQPGETRLLHRAWLEAARRVGRTQAYLRYHWQQENISAPLAHYLWLKFKLWLRRILQPPPSPNAEGCPPWELSYTSQLEMYRQFFEEAQRPRNYAFHGLAKLPHPWLNQKLLRWHEKKPTPTPARS
jgi:cellulose synthase/poly-beta-1,6-N-acetylglucosamine synthase-like glycosyltransferase